MWERFGWNSPATTRRARCLLCGGDDMNRHYRWDDGGGTRYVVDERQDIIPYDIADLR